MLLHNFVISLATAEDRRAHIINEFGKLGIEFQFFDAITADTLAIHCESLGLNHIFVSDQLSNGEKGCFISHAYLWQHMIDNNWDCIAIFEDDVHLGNQAELFLCQYSWLPNEVGLLKVEHFAHEAALQPAIKTINNRKIQQLESGNLGTAGYVIRQNSARKLLNLLKNKSIDDIVAVDHFMFQEVIKNRQIFVHQLNPALCIQSDRLSPTTMLKSNISNERRQRMNEEKLKRTFGQKLRREIGRLFGQIAQSSKQVEKIEFR